MADITIPDLAELARLRLARTTQVNALPPQPDRYDINPHSGFRRPYAHATYPGLMGRRTGVGEPRLNEFKEQALEAGVPITDVELLTIDDLLVTADTIGAMIGGSLVEFSISPTAVSREKDAPMLYVPSGRGGTASVGLYYADGAGTFYGDTVPNHVFLRGLSVATSGETANGTKVTIMIGSSTTLVSGMPVSVLAATDAGGHLSIVLSQFIERGGPLAFMWGSLDPIGVGGQGHATLSYEFGVRKAA